MSEDNQPSSKAAGKDQPFFVDQNIELQIDSLSFGGGRGVARMDGFVFFVPNTAPGDQVLAKVRKLKKSFGEADLLEVLIPSPHRITPPCPVADKCGGCCWQHVDYGEQLNQKELIVKKALKRLTANEDIQHHPIVPSPNQYRYRNRIQVHKDLKSIGFFQTKSKSLVPVSDCLIAEEVLIEKFQTLLNLKEKRGRYEISRLTNGEVNVRGKNDKKLTGRHFAQVNQSQNLQLIDKLIQTAKSLYPPPKEIYDLYSGAGNFTFPLADVFKDTKVIGVELSSSAIDEAKSRPLNNTVFYCDDVSHFLEKHPCAQESLVVLDPPRDGCDLKVVESLSNARPKHIIYVSCNPLTLARDLERLSDKYRIKEITPFDMFPQTDHVEVFCFLELKI